MVGLIRCFIPSLSVIINHKFNTPHIPEKVKNLAKKLPCKTDRNTDVQPATLDRTRKVTSVQNQSSVSKASTLKFSWKKIAACVLAIFLLISGSPVFASSTSNNGIVQSFTPIHADNPFFAYHERGNICIKPSQYAFPRAESLPSPEIPFLSALKQSNLGKTLNDKFISTDKKEAIQAATDLIAMNQGSLITDAFLKTHQGKVVKNIIDFAVKANYGKNESEVIQKLNADMSGGTCFGNSLSVIKHIRSKHPINIVEFYNDIIFFQMISVFGFENMIEIRSDLKDKISQLVLSNGPQEEIEHYENLLSQADDISDAIYLDYLTISDLQYMREGLNQEILRCDATPESREKLNLDFQKLIQKNHDALYLQINIHSESMGLENHSIAFGLEEGNFFVQDIQGFDDLPESLDEAYRPFNTLNSFSNRDETVKKGIQYIIEKYGQEGVVLEIVGYK